MSQFRAERDREGRRGGIRVDVERVPRVIEIGRDRGDDRDAPRCQLIEDRLRIDADDIADRTEVVLGAVDDNATAASKICGCASR